MKNTNIAWTDSTFNPWIGCTKVSAGCKNCYAEARDKRYEGGIHWGEGATRRRTTVANWTQPMKWADEARRAAAIFAPGCAAPARPRVFCASLADWMDDEIPMDWLADLMDVIRLTPELDWLMLTKRPQNIKPRLTALLDPTLYDNQKEWDRSAPRRAWLTDWIIRETNIPENIWIGTSVENQEVADTRIPDLYDVPAAIRFLSCEPLLGPVDLTRYCEVIDGPAMISPMIHWVICGGESGSGARPMDEAWARSLREQCVDSGTAFFMKQMGGAGDKRDKLEDLPADLQLRQFP